MDAAIAASATLCIVEPHMTGIGGDCFVILSEPDGKLYGLNGSGRSPANIGLQWFLDNGITGIDATSPHAVTVPGAVKAWETLHSRFGAMDFTRLFSDAIYYGEEGFPVAPRVARDWRMMANSLVGTGAKAHLLKDGKSPKPGENWKFPALANVLRSIAQTGSRSFYEGAFAKEIARTIQELGGFLTEEDLASVSADWVNPISTKYLDHELHEIPPNGQGITALILANLLGEVGLPDEASDPARAHMEIECGRLAYSIRDNEVTDHEHMTINCEEVLSAAYTQALAAQFDRTKRNQGIVLPKLQNSSTVYLSVVDRDQRAISFINSVYDWFGSTIVTEKSGIVLQSRGSGFNVKQGHPNAIGPSKRPLHTIIPAMATKNGKTTHSFGVMGGAYQPMGHAHVLSNMLFYGMDPQQTLDDPRVFWDRDGNLLLESMVPAQTKQFLENFGHTCKSAPSPLGGGQVIHINHQNGTLIAGSDPRKDGQASGF